MSDPSGDQLMNFLEENKNKKYSLATSAGIPIGDKMNSLTIGPRGPILLQDTVFIDEMAHFDRERIPERVVHAKGAGAFGYFECTHDITRYTKAIPFSEIGKKTDIFMRLSTVAGESGSADTVRGPCGFAVKFYTEHGNWDLVGNNTPIFFIRDPIFFPSFIHTQKRNPRTHLKDANMVWDFMSLRPESTHQYLFIFSDRGIPDGFRHMHGYGSHTFKLVNTVNEAVYCKFHFRTNQGVKNIPAEKSTIVAGESPDYSIKDLYNAIENKNYPSWNAYIQVMTYKEAESCPFNPFDITKVWPQGQYPLIQYGKLVLNRNPKNYFTEVEQAAFCPANMIPGIEASPDKMLQGRLFSYSDSHRHRLGPNFNLIPVNLPRCPFRNFQRDGFMRTDDNCGDMPNYFPNSFSGVSDNKIFLDKKEYISGDIYRHESANEDNYSQPRVFYTKVLDSGAKLRLASNIGDSLSQANEFIRARTVKSFMNVHEELGRNILAHMEKLGVKTCLNCQL